MNIASPQIIKIGDSLGFCEIKIRIVYQQCGYTILNVVSCVADYMGFTSRHLFQRIEEHRRASSFIAKHLKTVHRADVEFSSLNFKILRKCRNEFECLLFDVFTVYRIRIVTISNFPYKRRFST